MESAVATGRRALHRDRIVRVVRADITEMEADAFVFYAQPSLVLGSGIGGAISSRGGSSIQRELTELAKNGPLPTGEAVVTGAGKLLAKHIIHAVGPRFREDGTEEKLYHTMVNCLRRADEVGAVRLAFPAMGSGYYGIPSAVSARVMFEALRSHLDGDTPIRHVVICVLDTPQLRAFEAVFEARS